MNIHRKLLFAIGLAAFLLCDLPITQAGNADPQTGYNSLYDNILEKGANNGRCNAIGALGSVICGSTADQLVPPINPVITELCEAVGVIIELPYESCYQPIDCVVDWSPWGACMPSSIGIGDPCLQSRTGTIVSDAQYGGTCPFLTEIQECECPI
jgi:hypothetical protein